MPATALAPPPTPTSARPRFPPAAIVAVVCVGGLGSSMTHSLVIPIQGDLPRILNAAPSSTAWAITATLLASAVTVPVAGRLADMYGKRCVLIGLASVLAVGSSICASADSLEALLVGRVLQGMAWGYIPVAMSMVRGVVRPDHAASAVASVSATMGVGTALGLPLAAWTADRFSWNALFWVSAALALLTVVLTALVVPQTQRLGASRIDVIGAVGLAAGLTSALVGVSKGNDWGWTTARTTSTIFGGLLVLAAWVVYEWRNDDPLVNLHTTTRPAVLCTLVVASLIGFGQMAQTISVPQLLQLPESTGHGLGQSILQVGLWMAPGGVVMILFTPVSSTLINRIGARRTLATGVGVVGVSSLVGLVATGSPRQLMLVVMINSAGIGIAAASLPTLILDNVPSSEASSSVSVNSLMRTVGSAVASAVMAAIITGRSVEVDGSPTPTLSAFQVCFVVGALAAFTGVGISLLAQRHTSGDTPAGARPERPGALSENAPTLVPEAPGG